MTLLTLQQLSISMEDGKVLRWLVPDGAPVAKGDVVVEVETDKATMEVEAPADGILRIVADAGAIVAVDGVLGELQDGAHRQPTPGPEPVRPAAAGAVTTVPADASGIAARGAQIASPAARRLAGELGIDLTAVQGTGPGGRIVARDLEELAAAPPVVDPPAAPREGVLRDAVVRNIVASWQQIPHVQIGGELVADGLVAARAQLKARGAEVTVTDLIAYALARALAEVPELNGIRRQDGTIARSAEVHLSLAVATAGGVLAPVLRDAGALSLGELAAERARLVAAARGGSLDPRALAGGTVTLSNLGAYPVDFFAPVVSGPQIAMVATGRVAEKPVAERGWIAVRPRLWANVAIDHRSADGEAGGRLLAALERRLAELPGTAA